MAESDAWPGMALYREGQGWPRAMLGQGCTFAGNCSCISSTLTLHGGRTAKAMDGQERRLDKTRT